MKQKHDLCVNFDYNAMHHGTISCTASVVDHKHDVILKWEQERCQSLLIVYKNRHNTKKFERKHTVYE